MTRELFTEIVSRQMWFHLFLISIAYSISWFLGIRLCLLIVGVKVSHSKIYTVSLIGALYSFWARQLLPLPLVGIGLPVLLSLLVWIIARGLHPLKYLWAALTMLVFTFLGGTIFECALSLLSPTIGRFLMHTAWGCLIGTGIEDLGPIIGLLVLPRILPKLKAPLTPPAQLQPDSLEISTFIIYFAVYCSTFFTTMMTYISLINGYPYSYLFLILQLLTAFIMVVIHYRIVTRFGTEKAALISEKTSLEEAKDKLEADKAKLETEKTELLKKLKKYMGANQMEVALKTQQLDEIFSEFIDRVQNIYNPNTTVEQNDSRTEIASSGAVSKPALKTKYKLTPREILILKGIVAGKMNKEIADEVFLVEGTVTNHITKLFRKFGVRNREELTRFVIENELIDPK